MHAMSVRGAPREEKVLAAAGGFTGLWALTWLGSSAVAPSAALQGGLAVGSVMAGSGLTLLWWKTQTMHALMRARAQRERADDLSWLSDDRLSAFLSQLE